MKLKNGSEELDGLVGVTMMSVRRLTQTHPIAFYELVMLCRDPKHKLFGNTGQALNDLSLVTNGQVHDSIRNIVLSAIEGEGMDMTLVSPVA
jgi:hypothetical protein